MDLCDVVYALLVQRLEADVRSDQLAAQFSAVMGGKPEWPSFEDRKARMDGLLVEEPKVIDAQDLALREALGLRSG